MQGSEVEGEGHRAEAAAGGAAAGAPLHIPASRAALQAGLCAKQAELLPCVGQAHMKIGMNPSYFGALMEASEQKALSHPLTKEALETLAELC